MTKTAIRKDPHNVRAELKWLLWREQMKNPDWRFKTMRYSKRRASLVRTWRALKAM